MVAPGKKSVDVLISYTFQEGKAVPELCISKTELAISVVAANVDVPRLGKYYRVVSPAGNL